MNGDEVRRFEVLFAKYVGAEYAIALCNGTATLHTALVALGVKPGDRVAVPPLTMASTTIAVLHAGALPVFVDIEPNTWLMRTDGWESFAYKIPVSLYGLHAHFPNDGYTGIVEDAAQTFRVGAPPHFRSYSFQTSKILPLGEGGMLVTNDVELATKAREFSSLGYFMEAWQPRIDPAILKRPKALRHHRLGWNYRMNDLTAERGASMLLNADALIAERRTAARFYREAVRNCAWITPQHVPAGWEHDYWTYAVALESAELWDPFTEAIVRHGGEMPYGAWRLTYQEPAFRHLVPNWTLGPDPPHGVCPIAEGLQPRIVQFQTNDVDRALRNADAVAAAIKEIDG